ncbi:phosphatase PAP2 family protein [Namhaeicola litoreus]|uniref:Phosphatase PAP2 family protein n=1 Tax=Namhaeicola litoreus TaxID=1052145 RepID=A0ABW3XZP3_9FLAO
MDKLINSDKELFIYLNGLGNESWDPFWVAATNMLSWIPLFLFFIYLMYRFFGLKKTIALVVIVALLITFSDQFANLIKYSVGRLRPNRDPEINTFIRILKNNKSFSFFSAHAGTSMAVTTFVYFTLRKKIKYAGLFFIWPLFFAYSRIYIGVHFPLDILAGGIFGVITGILFYKVSLKILDQPFLNSQG